MLPATVTPIWSSSTLGGTMIAERLGATAPPGPRIAATFSSDDSPPWTKSSASTPSALAIRLGQPTDTVRVPVSRRPMVCGVVGGSHFRATSSSVIPRARRTSRIRVIMAQLLTKEVYSLSYRFAAVARRARIKREKMAMESGGRLLQERAIEDGIVIRGEAQSNRGLYRSIKEIGRAHV